MYGQVFFAGAGFNLFAVSSCGGTDENSDDKEWGEEAAANQCSIAVDTNTGVTCEPEPLGVDCGPARCETLGHEYATTELMTADTLKRIDNGIRCVGDWIDGELRCHPEESRIIRERVVADRLRLETSFFNNGSFDNEPEPVDKDKTDNATEGVHSDNLVNGVCSQGRVERGETTLLLNTKDGAYDSSAPRCKEGFN
ncbi:hypothetical protein FIV42_14865 [Persicimonas caeni]|uniref:Uncharacterized protein n=1 Tax=Persicimonas caeni TaxID=2292766 RepID=A0A4Y6PUQ6_PERCE|nr:hypothetical protein [Persicimonas caeni]QDG51973.1 hypothetical protein FIV42_14865 [Persicimonas caeni]QED33194.1 hypothetical protein FRD00_14860 [Persicimonas caeni]